jgi:DNA-binding transcriptional regulator GbsR (MarR family)
MTDISVMTETTIDSDRLPAAVEAFVLRWGDLGGQWGVNRSVAQIHALLMVSDKPLTAEDIAGALGIARSNVSNSVKELLNWDLIRRAPIEGDRRDHYVAESDMWEMTSRIVAMRKARELDPASKVLDACLAGVKADPAASGAAVQRLSDLQELIGLLNGWYDQMNKLPKSTLLPLLRMGTKAVDVITPFVKKKES